VPQKPGTGDGKIVASSGQIGRLFEAGGYLPLSNGERQFAAKRLAPQRPTVEPVSEKGGEKGGERGEFTFFVFFAPDARPERALFGRDFASMNGIPVS